MLPFRLPLQVVFYQEDGDWVAHCLQFDLVGVAPTRHEAVEFLHSAIATQVIESIQSQNFRNLFSPADSQYHQMFAAGRDVLEGELQMKIAPSPELLIERIEVREFPAELSGKALVSA